MKKKTIKKPKPVSFQDVSTISMVTGGEKRFTKVIHDGAIKEWVGIGWIVIGHARPSDYTKIPEVKG